MTVDAQSLVIHRQRSKDVAVFFSSTAYQARDIMRRQGNPPSAKLVEEMIDRYIPSVMDQVSVSENFPD